MPSKHPALRTIPGKITHVPEERIKEIRAAANLAIRLAKSKNISEYERLIKSANKTLSKFERGLFVGFAMCGQHHD